MKKIINLQNTIKSLAFIAIAGFFAVGAPLFAASVAFNTSSADCATVRVRNVTQGIPVSGVGPSGCDSLSQWTTGTISANPGDIIAVSVYYHNTGTQTATGTKVKVTTPKNMASSTSHTISANVSSSNGGYASGSVNVNLSESQTLKYITNSSDYDSTVWYDNGNGGPYTISSNVDQNLFNSTGIYANADGIVEANWADQGTVRMRFIVGDEPVLPNGPTVTTQPATSVDTANVTLNGTINNFGQASQTWFKYGNQSNPLNNQTQIQSIGGSNSTQSFSAQAIGTFAENTTYYYQACGRFYGINGSQDVCGSTNTFSIAAPTVYACSDNIDNDGDGYTDFPSDQGCSSATDNNEYNYIAPTVYACSDNIDNDGDGYTDFPSDQGCSSATDNNEYNYIAPTVYACSDNIDNDGDGYTDYPYDPGCSSYTDTNEYNSVVYNYNLNVNTFNADNIDEDSARLRGEITQIGNQNVNRYFEWGTSSSNLNRDLTVSGSTGYTGSFDGNLTGLNSNTTYYFRACAISTNNGDVDCGNTRSFRTNTTVNNSNLSTITTEASSVGRTSAVLNGLAISDNIDINQMWFEWGQSTNLGRETTHVTINASGTRSLARSISGLSTNTIYYYRAVAQDDNGNIDRGDIKFFRTTGSTIVITNPEPPIIIETPVDVTGAGSLFLALDIEPDFDNVVIGDTVDYTVKYRNISNSDLRNVVIQTTLAEETRFMKSTAGFYSQADHNVTVVVGDLDYQEEGSFLIRVEILRGAAGDLVVTQASAGHDHPSIIDAQVGTVPAYAINHVVNDQSRLVGLALFGGAFFPTTLIGWLILLLIIILIVLLARKYYIDREDKKGRSGMQIN